ncbi:APC family permease [Leucobacter massiliensis]|uniref:Amino acid permease n=1 Tax=Leucobacter massiliensis TaxID=1686285 RepID=A0A2S9QQT7_9MICO|nr:amino acid permease [Leucobacter massiliensis]PRI11947.1 amino acid permease [Leucobacter massiliensis]
MTTRAPAAKGHTLRREFSFGAAFAFAFAFISPIVALYGIFGLAIMAAGPSFWWGFLIVFAGQLLVALVFAMLVSRWPLEGSIYQWANRLLGSGYGWFAGWFYIWTLTIAMATVALGAAGFIANIIGLHDASGTVVAGIAFIVLILGTLVNLAGRGVLKVFMMASIVAEVVGSIGLGTWLLIAHREQDLSILFDGGASIDASEGFFSLGGPFLLAVVFIGFSFVGFESAGSIAEEVHEPRRALPKAMLFSICFIALVVMFSSLAIILATPENAADLPDYDVDPVYAVLTAQLGSAIAIPLQVLFAIGFIASFLALQTSASRLIWAKARDGALPFSAQLSRLSAKQRQPVGPLLVTAAIGTALFLLSNVAENLYLMMVNFTSGGFYLSFLFPVAAFAVTVLRRRWQPGPFSLRGWTAPVAVIALVWVVAELINIAWPRPLNGNAWLDWSVIIGAVALAVAGAAVYARVRHRIDNVATAAIMQHLDEADATSTDHVEAR